MKKLLPYAYLLMSTTIALAHGGADDGHVEAVPVADPNSRIYVIISVGVVCALVIAWFVWSKRKSSQ